MNTETKAVTGSGPTMKYEKTSFETRLQMGAVSRALDPYCGICHRCGRTWDSCESHTTEIEKGHGCFALCQDCWEELDRETRLPYYKMLYDGWVRQHSSLNIPMDTTWEQIANAVNNEPQVCE